MFTILLSVLGRSYKSFFRLNPFVTSGTYMSHLQRVFFKSTGITVFHFFSMLPSTLKYLYSVEPVIMHFPAKQPCTNYTVCNAACSIAHGCFAGKCMMTGSTE